MSDLSRRREIPRGYDGKNPTYRAISALLPKVLKRMAERCKLNPQEILMSWPQIVGEKLAKQTRAVSFQEGIMVVNVMNSTLLSLLAQHEKQRILKHLREKFPNTEIKNVIFKMGNISNTKPM